MAKKLVIAQDPSEAQPTVARPWETEDAAVGQEDTVEGEFLVEEDSVEGEILEPTQENEDPVEGEVLVTVPKAFRLTLDNHVVKEYRAGVQAMSKEHAEHWWAKSQGVEVYKGVVPGENAQAAKLKQLIDQKFHELEALPPAEKEVETRILFDELQSAILGA